MSTDLLSIELLAISRIRNILLAAYVVLPCCHSTDSPSREVATFNNSVSGHCDVLVSNNYLSEDNDFFPAAAEALSSDRFLIAWVDDYYGSLSFRRYDVSDGGFLDAATVLSYSVQNVHKAGSATVNEGGISQSVAWLTWDYVPSPSYRSICFARIRNDGTYLKSLNTKTDAAGATGARGNTYNAMGRPEQRILITYVTGNIEFGYEGNLPCGERLEGLIYHPNGTLLVGPLVITEASGDDCVAAPSATFNSYASRFEIVYQYRQGTYVWWNAKHLQPDGTVESVPHVLDPICAVPLKSTDSTLSGPECHRHTVAFDSNPSRNATNRFAVSNYGWLYTNRQDSSHVSSIYVDSAMGFSSVVDMANQISNYSYQTFKHDFSDGFWNVKFYDNSPTPEDLDSIGSRPCDSGQHRGYCYHNEAMANGGTYTAAMYGDMYGETPPNPLVLCIMDGF